jgi:hypothetical protein
MGLAANRGELAVGRNRCRQSIRQHALLDALIKGCETL